MGQENFVGQENLVIVYGSKDRLIGQEKILGLCHSPSGWGKKIISGKEIYWGLVLGPGLTGAKKLHGARG